MHEDAFWGVLTGVYLGEAVEVARSGVIGVRYEQGHSLPLQSYGSVDLLRELAYVVERADHDCVGVVAEQFPLSVLVEEVRLVQAKDGGRGDGSGVGTALGAKRFGERRGDGPTKTTALLGDPRRTG